MLNTITQDEKTEKVRTEKFVKVSKPGEVIYGYGLEAAQDVVWTFAGLRPLLAASQDDPKSVTRDYVLDFDRSGPPLLSVYGGKLTTYRQLSETVVDMIAPVLGNAGPAWTATSISPCAVIMIIGNLLSR